MTITSALQGIYPNQIISEPVRLGSKLFIEMDNNALAHGEIGYWVTREGTSEVIFKFDTKGVVRTYTDITPTNHEKRIITKIISMWRDNMRPDWETWGRMRLHPVSSESYTTLVPVMHNTL